MQITFDGEQLKALRGPVVYVAKKAGVPTYVGMSTVSVGRAFHRDGNLPDRNKALAEADELTITTYDLVKDAFKAESKAIHEHHPVGNLICPACGERKNDNNVQVLNRFVPYQRERRSSVSSAKRSKILKNVAMHMVDAGDSDDAIQSVVDLF